jgi:hypothetical protein
MKRFPFLLIWKSYYYKIAISSKFNAIAIKSIAGFFTKINRLIKILMEMQKTQNKKYNNQDTLKRIKMEDTTLYNFKTYYKATVGGFTFSNFKTYHKTIIIKTG